MRIIDLDSKDERLIAALAELSVGASDMTHATSLSGVDLVDDPLAAMAQLQVLATKNGHPVSFWRRTGYSLVGVTPDAEAEGQPSIQFARSLRNVGKGDD